MVVRMGLLTLPALHTARPPLLSPTYVSLCPSVPCWVQERYRGTACSSGRYHKSYSKLNWNNNGVSSSGVKSFATFSDAKFNKPEPITSKSGSTVAVGFKAFKTPLARRLRTTQPW